MSADVPEAAFDDPRWSLILAALLEGKNLTDAADRVDLGYRQVRRIVQHPEFARELRERQRELDEASQATLLEHRRAVLGVAGLALRRQFERLNDTRTPPALQARIARDVEDHLVRLFPAGLDLAVVHAEPAAGPVRSIEEIFDLPPDVDEATIYDFGRALYHKLRGVPPVEAGPSTLDRASLEERMVRDAAAEEVESPELVDQEPDPPAAEPEPPEPPEPELEPEPEPEHDPEPEPAPAIPLPSAPESAPRWSDGLATQPPRPPEWARRIEEERAIEVQHRAWQQRMAAMMKDQTKSGRR